jgi:hypothetical protein
MMGTGRTLLLLLGIATTLVCAAESIPLDEIVKNNELPKRVALTKATAIDLSESTGSINLPAGVGVEVVGTENGKLKVRFAAATGLIAPDDTDLSERVLLVRKQKEIPAENAPVTATASTTSSASATPAATSSPATENNSSPTSSHRIHHRPTFHPPEPGSPLSKILPPTDPNNKAAWKSYIDDITRFVAANHPDYYSSEMTEIGMLVKVGPSNADLLAASLGKYRSPADFSLVYAINYLAAPENKDIILKNLPVYPNLIDSVRDQKWLEDAKPILLQEMRKNRTDLPNSWIVAAAQLNDPDANDNIRRYLSKTSFPAYTLKNLQEETTLDISDVAIKRYKEFRRSRDNFSAYELITLAQVAATCGEPDALKTLCDLFTGKLKLDRGMGTEFLNEAKNDARKAVMQLTEARGSDEEIDKWVRTNFARLSFDKESKRYVVK